jgi:mRNA-degrading endonuclease RelE of RelBE toxin-antitoxin system
VSYARAALQDLYIKEARVEIPRPPDEEGNERDPIVFYARKMNPLQQESASRKASAAQIHMRRLQSRPDDPDYIVVDDAIDEIEDLSRFIAEVETGRERDKAEQELAEEDEWSKDNYYQSLIDAWTPERQRDFTENADEDREPETKKIWAEMKRFENELESLLKQRRTKRMAEVEELPLAEQRKIAFKFLLEQQCNTEWLRVFNIWRIIYGIVDEDKNPVFKDEDDVMSAPAEAQRIFRRALDELSLSVTEVKS